MGRSLLKALVIIISTLALGNRQQQASDFSTPVPYDAPLKSHKFKSGYVRIQKGKKSTIVNYIYIHSTAAAPPAPQQTPVTIMQVGGPALSNMILLLNGVGPIVTPIADANPNDFSYIFNSPLNNKSKNAQKLKLFENEFSILKVSDLLLWDIPLGVGCSHRGIKDVSSSDVFENNIDFMARIQDEIPDLRKKPVYFIGISYSAIWTTQLAIDLHEKGWKIAGFVIESGMVEFREITLNISSNLYENGTIGWAKHAFWEFFAVLVDLGRKMDFFGWRGLVGLVVDAPVVGLTGELITSPMDVRPKMQKWFEQWATTYDYFNNENFTRGTLGCDKKFVGERMADIGAGIAINDAHRDWRKNVGRLIDEYIPVMVVDGKYDFPFGTKSTLAWLENVKQVRELEFHKLDWEKVEFGRRKIVSKTLEYYEVHDAGHSVVLTNPKAFFILFKRQIENGLK